MFGRNIWSEAVHVSWENLSVIALVVVALLLLLIVSDYFGLSASSTGIGSTLIWILLAIAGHATVLKGRSGLKGIDNSVMMPFLYRTMGLVGLTLIPVFIGIFFTISYGETAIYLTVLLIAGISSILVLGKWGTWLPAVVAGGDRSLRSAGRRGGVFSVMLSQDCWQDRVFSPLYLLAHTFFLSDCLIYRPWCGPTKDHKYGKF